MVRFPAFCPKCGLVFESGIEVNNSRNVTFSGTRQTCPRCGEWAELPDGTFNVTGDTIEVLVASGLTRARLMALAEILNLARSGEMPTEAAVEQVVAEAPALRPLIDRYGPTMRKALIHFLYFVITLLIAQGISELRDDSATREDVRQAVEQALQQVQRQGPSPSAEGNAGTARSAPRRPVPRPRPPPKSTGEKKGQQQAAKPKREKKPPKHHGKQKQHKRQR